MKQHDLIIPFARPRDLPFLVDLVRDLRSQPRFRNVPVRFLTMWKLVADTLTKWGIAKEHEVMFIPKLLPQANVHDLAQLDRLDAELSSTVGVPAKIMLDAERFRPTDPRAAQEFLARHLMVFDSLIPKGALVLSNEIDHLSYWLAAGFAAAREGEFFGFSNSGRPAGYSQVMRGPNSVWLPFAAEANHLELVRTECKRIRSGEKPPYMNPPKKPGLAARLRWRLTLTEELRHGNYHAKSNNLPGVLAHRSRSQRWKQALKICKPRRLETFERPFVYLPLHLEPEASTAVYSPLFRNQEHVVESIAKSLPIGVDLVVKENPGSWGTRDLGFYTRISQLPDVHWIAPETPSWQLIEKAAATLTITGTAALEAVALGRPTAMFGVAPYRSALSAIPLFSEPRQLPQQLRNLLKGEGQPELALLQQQFALYVANLVPAPYTGNSMAAEIPVPITKYHECFAEFITACMDERAAKVLDFNQNARPEGKSSRHRVES